MFVYCVSSCSSLSRKCFISAKHSFLYWKEFKCQEKYIVQHLLWFKLRCEMLFVDILFSFFYCLLCSFFCTFHQFNQFFFRVFTSPFKCLFSFTFFSNYFPLSFPFFSFFLFFFFANNLIFLRECLLKFILLIVLLSLYFCITFSGFVLFFFISILSFFLSFILLYLLVLLSFFLTTIHSFSFGFFFTYLF